MKSKSQRLNWTSTVNMVAADASKAIQASPGVGYRLNITKLIINITTAAAQTFDVESVAGGVTELFKAPASLPVGNYIVMDSEGPGVPLPENTGLSVVPAAAGVAGTFFAEGDIEHLATSS